MVPTDFVYGWSQFITGVIFLRVGHVKYGPLWHFFLHTRHIFLQPGGYYSTTNDGVVIRRYTGEEDMHSLEDERSRLIIGVGL